MRPCCLRSQISQSRRRQPSLSSIREPELRTRKFRSAMCLFAHAVSLAICTSRLTARERKTSPRLHLKVAQSNKKILIPELEKYMLWGKSGYSDKGCEQAVFNLIVALYMQCCSTEQQTPLKLLVAWLMMMPWFSSSSHNYTKTCA